MDKNHIDDLDVLGGTVGADGKYALTADSVVLLKNTVTAIDGLERSFEDVQTKIKAMVANLQRLLESNSKSVLQKLITLTIMRAVRCLCTHGLGCVRCRCRCLIRMRKLALKHMSDTLV
jgi:hypothetical protein